MMKKSIYILLLLVVVLVCGCESHEVATKYDRPDWTVTANSDYSVSMTAAVQLPEALNPYLTEDDMMAALVGDEVRAIARLYEGIFYLQIPGMEDEQVQVSIQYWNAKTHYKYRSEEPLQFEENAICGTPDEPLILTFKVL